MKNFLKTTFGILLLFLIGFYLCVVFVLPSIISSKIVINKLQSLIYNKTGIDTSIEGLNLKISPKLTVILEVDSINAKNNNVSVIDIKNISLNFKLLQKQLINVSADNIFVDGNYLKQFKREKKKKKNKLELKNIPEIHIKKFAYKSDKFSINAENTDTIDKLIKLKAEIHAPFLKETLKLGESGTLQVAENEFKANKFKIALGNSNLYLDGIIIDKNKSPNLDITGEKLPLSEIMSMLLYFQKSKDSSRKFVENFKNFKGTVNVNLKLNKDGLWGKCVGNHLSANAVWFDIPIFFKEAVFNFNGKKIVSIAEGILGNEKVVHTLDIINLGTPENTVVGAMYTTLTPKFNFVPNLTILNSINANLIYKVKSKKPDVYYNIDIPINSDLIYNSFYLGLRDYKREIHGNTLKVDNNLYLKEYKYSYLDSSDRENIILSGDGLFMKHVDELNPDKFVPQFVTCQTNGYAPISVTGSFGEKIRGGEFKGNLRYDFNINQILGTFDIINARHKDFKIDNAHVDSKNGIFNITANGLFKGEKYSAELSAKNNIFGETLIYNMKLFLDKLVFETISDTNKKNKKTVPKDFSKKVKDIDITINNWEIAVNEIKRESFVLQNVKLIGSLKNHIFDFNMKDLIFADGSVHANGFYDFAKDISNITFEAENIDSNKVAEMTLNLQDQIEGIASAKVELSAKDMFKFLDAYCMFEVKEGFLPKLGDTEFMIKNSKYRLSDITNFDLSQKDLMKDDIKGTFDVHNTEIKNINITTWHELSAMYLKGNYEMERQYADLQLFWKYNKDAPKGIRIFGVPFSLILKVVFRPEHTKEIYKSELSKIPEINSDEINTNYYRVHLNGDINNKNSNSKKINLVLKEIR